MFDTLDDPGPDLLTIDPTTLDDEALTEFVRKITELVDRAVAQQLRGVGEFDARQCWRRDVAPSPTTWLTAQGRLGGGHAKSLVEVGRRLRTMPITQNELNHGRLATDKARLLAGVINERTQEAFARDESLLVARAQELTVDQTRRMLRYWLLGNDPDGPKPDDLSANSYHLIQLPGGRWDLKGNLDQESGTILDGVLTAHINELKHSHREAGDPVPPGQLKVEALVEMARRALGSKAHARPLVIAVRTDKNPLVDTLMGGGPILPATTDRYLCDADLAEAIVNQAGQIMSWGRTKRTATDAQRHALSLRFDTCGIPGCDRPFSWTQLHHVEWWSNGGPTDLDKLLPACDYHHHRIHAGDIVITIDADGRILFFRRDGSPLIAPPISG